MTILLKEVSELRILIRKSGFAKEALPHHILFTAILAVRTAYINSL